MTEVKTCSVTVWYEDFKDFPNLKIKLNLLIQNKLAIVIKVCSTHLVTFGPESWMTWMYQ